MDLHARCPLCGSAVSAVVSTPQGMRPGRRVAQAPVQTGWRCTNAACRYSTRVPFGVSPEEGDEGPTD